MQPRNGSLCSHEKKIKSKTETVAYHKLENKF